MLTVNQTIFAFNANKFSEAKGYTVIDITYVSGTFNGADLGASIRLDNGMVFEFTEYQYSYSYRPQVVIFGRTYSVDEVKQIYSGGTAGFTSYKLLIDDDFYDAIRVK